MTSTQGHHFSGIRIENSTVVLGNIVSSGGVTINSKTATSAGVNGQIQASLRPVSAYVMRSVLYKQLKERLHDTLNSREIASKIVVVCGLGGAGKSQLVLHYIQTHRKDYSAVFWIEAGSKATLERDYMQMWRLLYRNSEEKVSIDVAVREVKAWLQQQEEKMWLLVFDSADSIDDDAHKDYIDLNAFIPEASCVDVIITTRSQTAKYMTEIEAVEVGDLEKEEALALLLSCSKINDPTENTKGEAILIVEELGRLALAVVLAGAYIAATPRISLETYLSEYRKRRKALLGRKAQRQVHRYSESVLTTWETSYAAITSQCPEASGFICLLAFLSPDDIFYELFTPLLDKFSKTASIWGGNSKAAGTDEIITQDILDSGLEILSKYFLLSWKEEQSSFAMHKLVNTWGYDRMTVEEQMKHGQEALEFVDLLLRHQLYGPVMRSRLVPHIMANFSRLQEWIAITNQLQEESLMSLATCSEFLRDNGQFSHGAAICQLRCKVSNNVYCWHHETVISAQADLALLYYYQGQYETAQKLQVKVLAAMKKICGEDHPDTLKYMNHLASTYIRQGKHEDAQKLVTKGLEISVKVFGEEHLDTLQSMNNLAAIYSEKGRYGTAEQLLVKVLEISKKLFGEEHPDTLTSMNNLAATCTSHGQYDNAEQLLVKTLEKAGRVLGQEHPQTLICMANLGLTYTGQGRYEEAEQLLAKVLEIRNKVLGKEHPETLKSMSLLASILPDQGKLLDASNLLRQCIKAQIEVLGEDHPDTELSVKSLIRTEMQLSAVSFEEAAMNVFDMIMADDDVDPSVRSMLREELVPDQDYERPVWTGEDDEVESSIETLPGIIYNNPRDSAGPNDRQTDSRALHPIDLSWKGLSVRDLIELGQTAKSLADNGDNAGFLETATRSLDGLEALLTPTHAITRNAMDGFLSTANQRGLYSQAQDRLKKSVDDHIQDLGDSHPKTLTLLDKLGSLLFKQRKMPEAELVWKHYLEAIERSTRLDYLDKFNMVNEVMPKLLTIAYRESETLKTKEIAENWIRLAESFGTDGRWAVMELKRRVGLYYLTHFPGCRTPSRSNHPQDLQSTGRKHLKDYIAWITLEHSKKIGKDILFSLKSLMTELMNLEVWDVLAALCAAIEQFVNEPKEVVNTTTQQSWEEKVDLALDKQQSWELNMLLAIGKSFMLRFHRVSNALPEKNR